MQYYKKKCISPEIGKEYLIEILYRLIEQFKNYFNA